MPTLTIDLARRMLDVWDRRKRYPRDTKFLSTLYEAALGAPDVAPKPPRRQFYAGLKSPSWKHDKGSRS